MNPPTFYGSKVSKDLQEFIDEVYTILYAMGVSSSENAELFTYKLKDISLSLYMQWRDNRPLTGGPMTWEIFRRFF